MYLMYIFAVKIEELEIIELIRYRYMSAAGDFEFLKIDSIFLQARLEKSSCFLTTERLA